MTENESAHKASSGGDIETIAKLLEQYLERLDSGESVDIELLLVGHAPQVADRVRACASSLLSVRGMNLELNSDGGDGQGDCMGSRQLGDFKILREIGRGGMGVVYEAEQISLRRRVALKVLPFASLLSKRQSERFRNEARAAAMLKHPRIVSVYSVGSERGLKYYAMEFVEGCSLAEVLRELRTREPRGAVSSSSDLRNRERGDLLRALSQSSHQSTSYCRDIANAFARVARAVHFAHQSGVVHRDLKPSNLLLDRFGDIHIADFGLAAVQSDDTLTMTGEVVGTLRYMSPEQASGRVCDQRTDVYSLGATLFELLTLRPMVEASERNAILNAISTSAPPSPRQHNTAVSRELETVLLKAVSREAADRYQTCEEFALDLQRFCDQRPVLARKPSILRRLIRWSQRNQAVAALAGSLLLLLSGLGIVGPIVAAHQARLATSERNLRQEQTFLAQELSAQQHRLKEQQYASEIRLAHSVLQNGDFDRALKLLRRHISGEDERDLRGFEWYHLWERCSPILSVPSYLWHAPIQHIAASPDGERVAMGGFDGAILVRSGERLAPIWEQQWISEPVRKRKKIESYNIKGHYRPLTDLRFSADGRLLMSLSLDGEFRVWRAGDGKLLFDRHMPATPSGFTSAADWAAFLLADDGSAQLVTEALRFEEGQVAFLPRSKLEIGNVVPRQVEVSSSGELLAIAVEESVQVWSVKSGELISDFKCGPVRDIAFSPVCEQELAVSIGPVTATEDLQGKIVIWDAQSAAERQLVELNAVQLGYSAGGDSIVAGTDDGYVVIVDPASSRITHEFRADQSLIWDVAFRGSDSPVITSSLSGIVRAWDLQSIPRKPASFEIQGLRYPSIVPTFNSQGLYVGGSMSPRFLDGQTGELLREWPRESGSAARKGRIAVSGNAKLLAEACGGEGSDGGLRVYDLATDSVEAILHKPELRKVADVSDDGKLVASCAGHDVVVLDVGTGRSNTLSGHCDNIGNVRFAGASGLLVSHVEGFYREVILWDVQKGQELNRLVLPPEIGSIDDMAVTEAGDQLIFGGRNGDILLYGLPSLEHRFTIQSAVGAAYRIAISPSADRIAAGNWAGGVRIWNANTGDELLSLSTPGSIHDVCFSRDGRTLFAAEATGRIHRYDSVTPIEVWRQLGQECEIEWLTESVIFPQSWK